MQTTVNYGLKKPEGTNVVNIDDLNDNADIIDQQLKRQTDIKTVSLPASGWTGSAAPYSQTVEVTGILATDTPVLVKMLAGTATEAVVKAYNKAFGFIFAGETANGTVTFKAYKKPATDLTVGLKGV